MFAFAVGITIIAIGVCICVWSRVQDNRISTETIGEQLERKRQEDRAIEQSINRAESTVGSISDGIAAEDKRFRDSIGGIQETVSGISERNKGDQEIFEEIRKQKLSD